jgi:hypothetical protein
MEVSGQLHAPAALPTGEVPDNHWIGGWTGPRAFLDTVVENKNSQPPTGIELPIIHPVAQRHTSDLWINIRDSNDPCSIHAENR